MTGHIRKRGSNSWELKFDIGSDPLTGQRQIKYASFKGTKRQAELKLASLITENARGERVDTSKMTLAEFIECWLRDWAENNVSSKTCERYAELLRLHVGRQIGDIQIQKLRPVILNELYAKLLRGDGGRKLAARTVGHVHRVLHRALGHAVRWDLVVKNVAALVTPPKVPATELEILAPAQVQIVLRKFEGRSLYPIMITALATGMRRGELCALRWRDVDLDGPVIRIERSLEQTKAGLRFKAPKTKHGRRSITLPASAVTVLRQHRAAQAKNRLRLGLGKAQDDALVFGRWDGEPRSPNSLTKEWSAAIASTGLPAVSLHSLRHTHASHLIASGLDVLAISRRLGHGSPTITLTVYGHLFPNADDRAAAAIESAFAT